MSGGNGLKLNRRLYHLLAPSIYREARFTIQNIFPINDKVYRLSHLCISNIRHLRHVRTIYGGLNLQYNPGRVWKLSTVEDRFATWTTDLARQIGCMPRLSDVVRCDIAFECVRETKGTRAEQQDDTVSGRLIEDSLPKTYRDNLDKIHSRLEKMFVGLQITWIESYQYDRVRRRERPEMGVRLSRPQ